MALFIIALDVLFMMNNPGQHFAHLGGVLSGILFAYLYRKNIDVTGWINSVIDSFVMVYRTLVSWNNNIVDFFKGRKKPKMKVHYGGGTKHGNDYDDNLRKRASEAEIDAILEKIKKNGYGALTSEEKKRLFDASRK